jgi:hypothetical protein
MTVKHVLLLPQPLKSGTSCLHEQSLVFPKSRDLPVNDCSSPITFCRLTNFRCALPVAFFQKTMGSLPNVVVLLLYLPQLSEIHPEELL